MTSVKIIPNKTDTAERNNSANISMLQIYYDADALGNKESQAYLQIKNYVNKLSYIFDDLCHF